MISQYACADIEDVEGDILIRVVGIYVVCDNERFRTNGQQVIDKSPVDLPVVHRVVGQGLAGRIHDLGFEHTGEHGGYFTF